MWNAIRAEQLGFAANAGWWTRGGPGGRVTTPSKVIAISAALLLVAAALIALVVLALCEPRWSESNTGPLVIWVDDSASMFAQEKGISRTLAGGRSVNRGEVHPQVPRPAEHLVVPVRRRVHHQAR